MKRTILQLLVCVLVAILCTNSIVGQAPQSFKYQAIARNSNGVSKAKERVVFQFSILEDSPSGGSVYVEQHVDSTNALGIVNLEIGNGSIVAGNFSSIDWGNHEYFLKIELDAEPLGTVQLLGVPYALHAKTVEQNDDDDADPDNEIQTLDLTDNTLSLSLGNSVHLSYDSSGWNMNEDTIYYNTGNVGIGTSSLAAKLDVQEGNISTSGYVLVPNRPAFSVYITDHWILGDSTILFDGITVNNGNHYDPVTGRFTAPVSGLYQFSYGGIKSINNPNLIAYMYLKLNGIKVGPTARASEGSNFGFTSVSYIIYLNAGDFVSIYNPSISVGGWFYTYTHFCGHLL